MRDAECKREENLYKLNKGYWNLYKVGVWMGEIYTSQYKYEGCIKRKNYIEGLYKKGIVGKGCIKTDNNCDRVIFLALILPIYAAETGGEFGSMCFVVCYAGTTLSMTRTVFRTRAIYVIMRTGHGYFPFLHDFACKVTKKKIQLCKIIVK